jgi:hypothetical protein
MNKIKTLFKRDNKFKVIDEYNITKDELNEIECWGFATEKVDGTNIRLTIRMGEVVRVEARKNPSKEQKRRGIINAWYRDVQSPGDKWIIDAVNSRTYQDVVDGDYHGEAFGKNIQGDVLNIGHNTVFIFDNDIELQDVTYNDLPLTYDELKEWLPKQQSKIGNGKIEGIVFWVHGEPVAKIKLKDFPKE